MHLSGRRCSQPAPASRTVWLSAGLKSTLYQRTLKNCTNSHHLQVVQSGHQQACTARSDGIVHHLSLPLCRCVEPCTYLSLHSAAETCKFYSLLPRDTTAIQITNPNRCSYQGELMKPCSLLSRVILSSGRHFLGSSLSRVITSSSHYFLS